MLNKIKMEMNDKDLNKKEVVEKIKKVLYTMMPDHQVEEKAEHIYNKFETELNNY
jgi:hypothetical protein